MQSEVTPDPNDHQPQGAVPATLTEDGFLGGRLQVLQPEKGFRAGIDSVFLAAAVPCQPGEMVFEAGIGAGAAALCLLGRTADLQVTGIELSTRYVLLCEENARRNGFDQNLKVIRADLRDALRKDAIAMPLPNTFHHAMANPPFHEEGKSTPSPHLLKAQAHALAPEDLEIWVRVLHSLVMPKGTVTLIHKADMLGKILALMDERFGDIRIAPLHPRHGAEAGRVLIQGIKGSKAPMQLRHGLVLHDESGQFTPEAEAVLRNGQAFPLR